MSVRHVRDRGQAVVLVLAAIAVAVVVTVALARFGVRVIERERAAAAADAAALAGVSGGREAAARVATANGGSLVSFVLLDAETMIVEVRVEVGGAVGVARAARAP